MVMLGILACTDKYMRHILGLCKAARKRGVDVSIFFTADSVFLLQDPEFEELLETGAEVNICSKTYRGFDLHNTYREEIPGAKLTAQEANAVMASRADRYVVF
jgi:sulfur relay (sulfurtransferase) complex TusBCD TusD component (DsrE family)